MVNLSGLKAAAIEALGIKIYIQEYLTNAFCGTHLAHDGDTVYFHIKVGKGHALHKTVNKYKDTIDPPRVERLRWIKEFISGRVPNSECWLIPENGITKRVYCSFGDAYMVWLGPRDQGGWKFETAYQCDTGTIRGYLKRPGAKRVCVFQCSTCASEQPQLSSQSDSASSTRVS